MTSCITAGSVIERGIGSGPGTRDNVSLVVGKDAQSGPVQLLGAVTLFKKEQVSFEEESDTELVFLQMA